MNPNIQQHAQILVNHSANIQQGDYVVVSSRPESTELVEAICKELGKVGAIPHLSLNSPEADNLYYSEINEDELIQKDHVLALWEKTDAAIGIRGSSNIKSTTTVDPELKQKNSKVNKDIQEARLSSKWVITQHPVSGNAQKAGMSTNEYREFVYNAITKDWEQQKTFQQNLVEILQDGSHVSITSGTETDIEMSIDGMLPVNDYGENNMPGGEVFTAPVVDSVHGTVLFDKPVVTHGKEVHDIKLTFEDGVVTDVSASKNEEVIQSIINTDEGSQRLGELGFGMNRDITEFTYNMLFDEKMGDTIHMALGRAYEDTVGEDKTQNQSAVHTDMIVDMSENSTIKVDGEVIQENGTFIFE